MESSKTSQSDPSPSAQHRGGCHCGAVRYEVRVDLARASKCNCTLCLKMSNIGAITQPDAFRLLEGEASLSEYVWGRRTGAFYFCKQCGIHVYGRGHVAELGGDFVSISVNTLDDVDPNTLSLVHWDGRHDNWQAGPRPEPWPVFAPS